VIEFKQFINQISEVQGDLRMCAKTALYNTREKVNFFNNNIDFIIEQKEYWQNQLYDIFEEISNVMKKKYDELNSQVTELFTKLERYNSE